jgi:hypothetical protein
MLEDVDFMKESLTSPFLSVSVVSLNRETGHIDNFGNTVGVCARNSQPGMVYLAEGTFSDLLENAECVWERRIVRRGVACHGNGY